MRAYFFGNMYLSSIQQGIQAAHATASMFTKYLYDDLNSVKETMLFEWANEHETMVLLNGGDCDALQDIVDLLNTSANPYPWARFRESTGALNSVTTSIGIVIPEKLYCDETRHYVRSEDRKQLGDRIMYNYETPDLTEFEWGLVRLLNKSRLAQ